MICIFIKVLIVLRVYNNMRFTLLQSIRVTFLFICKYSSRLYRMVISPLFNLIKKINTRLAK